MVGISRNPPLGMEGPGGIAAIHLEDGAFQFVDEWAAIRPLVRGAGNLERFDYWLNTFRYLRAMSTAGGLRADLDSVMARIQTQSDPDARHSAVKEVVALRVRLARAWEQMMTYLIASTDTPGELGTIANLEQHTRKQLRFLALHDTAIEKLTGKPLPADAQPGSVFSWATLD